MKINQLKDDLDYCERLIQENSSSFYRAFRTLEGEKAQAVFAIYAFCRLADDAIDEEKNPEIVRTMQRQLQAFAAGQVPDEPMWRALAWAFKRFNLDLSPFEDMLRGQLKDVDFKQAETLAIYWLLILIKQYMAKLKELLIESIILIHSMYLYTIIFQ